MVKIVKNFLKKKTFIPIFSKKSYLVLKKNFKMLFLIDKKVSKLELKKKINFFFQVKVKSIQKINRLGKKKKYKYIIGKKKNKSYAFITLHNNYKINIFNKFNITN